MALLLHQAAAACYLLAGITSWLGLGLGARRLERGSVAVLAVGAGLHLLAFSTLHTLETLPPITDLPVAVSFMACIGSLFFLVLGLRAECWIQGCQGCLRPLPAMNPGPSQDTHCPSEARGPSGRWARTPQ